MMSKIDIPTAIFKGKKSPVGCTLGDCIKAIKIGDSIRGWSVVNDIEVVRNGKTQIIDITNGRYTKLADNKVISFQHGEVRPIFYI
jgi:hypothetical protein